MDESPQVELVRRSFWVERVNWAELQALYGQAGDVGVSAALRKLIRNHLRQVREMASQAEPHREEPNGDAPEARKLPQSGEQKHKG